MSAIERTATPRLTFRFATPTDAAVLARMNLQLIEDERYPNRLSVNELERRMRLWVEAEYRAVLFEEAGSAQVLGYVMYQRLPDHVYVRQFFVARHRRREGIGRAAMGWLLDHAWRDAPQIRLDVLVGNHGALAFYRAVGFVDRCLTMQLERG